MMDILYFTSIAQAIKKSHQARHALTGTDSAIHVCVKVSLCVHVCFFFRFQKRGLGCVILRGQRPDLDGMEPRGPQINIQLTHGMLVL